jgi:hypothetical protein
MGGFTGASWRLTKVAIAAHVDLGQIRLENVPFFIADDSTGFDRQTQGILGLQVLLAVGGVRWRSDGVAEFGLPQRGGPNVRVANLVLDDWTILARAEVQGKPMDFYFDTGGGSYLMEPFRQAFPELAKLGKPEQWAVGGFGDPDGKWDVLVLPEVELKIGKGTALIRPARLVARPNQRGGLLSPDAFAQARSVTVDLHRMMLVVE